MRIKKFLSAKCPVWSGICLSCGRRRRLYCCVAIDGGGSSPRRTWLELLLILVNSRSSPSSTSWTKSGRSGGQYPHRLLRRRNALMPWLSAPVINPSLKWSTKQSRKSNSAPGCLLSPGELVLGYTAVSNPRGHLASHFKYTLFRVAYSWPLSRCANVTSSTNRKYISQHNAVAVIMLA